jgi:hypothetical protein
MNLRGSRAGFLHHARRRRGLMHLRRRDLRMYGWSGFVRLHGWCRHMRLHGLGGLVRLHGLGSLVRCLAKLGLRRGARMGLIRCAGRMLGRPCRRTE